MSDFEHYASNLFSQSPNIQRVGKDLTDKSNRCVRSISINIFQGGYEAGQLEAFNKAISPFHNNPNYNLNVRYFTCDDIKHKMLTERQFVDLMLNCDIHFIITHIHQNMERLNWNMTTLYQELLRLQAHNGFPSGSQLECPIFTQNKMEYIKCLLPLKLVNPTIKINFNDRSNFESYRQQITEFVETYKNQEGCGFVLKFPFVTNRKPFIIRKENETVGTYTDQIIYKVVSVNSEYYGYIPYIMVQPCMKNRKECKVAMIDGRVKYLCVNKRNHKGSKAFSHFPHTRLFEFAQNAVEVLRQANPSAIVKDSLIRVDIFQNNLGHMVVNEFESLEATCYCGDQNGIVKESQLRSDMAMFFLNILLSYLEL